MQPRHFISLLDLSGDEFRALINRAIELKNNRDPDFQPLKGKGHDRQNCKALHAKHL